MHMLKLTTLGGHHLWNPLGSDFVLSSTSSEFSPQDSKAIRDTRVYYVYSEEYTTYTQGCPLGLLKLSGYHLLKLGPYALALAYYTHIRCIC